MLFRSTHPWLAHIPTGTMAYEVIEDRKRLEEDFERPIRGMAYPMGSFSDEVVDVLKSCGIVYSRTTVSTERFNMPTDWLRLPATCHHKNPRLMELARQFIEAPPYHYFPNRKIKLFYLWGHSYEFNNNNNWNVIEEFCEYMGNREEVWYATNVEIYDYTQAFNRLEYSVYGDIIYNPTTTDIYIEMPGDKKVLIPAGETVKL